MAKRSKASASEIEPARLLDGGANLETNSSAPIPESNLAAIPFTKTPPSKMKPVCLSLENVKLQTVGHSGPQVSFLIREGEMVGVAGTWSEGLSELLQIICGWKHPAAGVVSFMGESVSGKSVVAIKASGLESTLFRANWYRRFFDRLRPPSIEMRLMRVMKNRLNDQAMQNLEAALRLFSLEQYRNYHSRQSPANTSQRCDLAEMLLRRPKLMVLHKPFAGLDPNQIEQLSRMLFEVCSGNGISILLTTETVPASACLFDRMFRLDATGLESIQHPFPRPPVPT